MTHAVKRTSVMGTPFRGKCIKCGKEDLGLSGALEDCPADELVSDQEALLSILGRDDDDVAAMQGEG